MATPELRIVLDRPDSVYAAGECVTGRVEVEARDGGQCEGLTLSWGWRTSGDGNSDRGEAGATTLFTGEWQAGERVSYPFTFDAPNGPFTFRGVHLAVEWSARAKADVRAGRDPEATAGFTVRPGDSSAAFSAGSAGFSPELVARQQELARRIMLGVAALEPFFLLGVAFFLRWIADLGDLNWIYFLIPVFGVAWAAVVLLLAGRPMLAARRLGKVEMVVTPLQARRGGRVTCDVRFRPSRGLSLGKATATLVSRERATAGGGENSRTYSRDVTERAVTLSEPRRLPAGQTVAPKGELTVPDDAPCSFAAASNAVAWAVAVRIELPGWADWTREAPITVAP
jgi:hypothetical protein